MLYKQWSWKRRRARTDGFKFHMKYRGNHIHCLICVIGMLYILNYFPQQNKRNTEFEVYAKNYNEHILCFPRQPTRFWYCAALDSFVSGI